jgi:hypothetical protein
MATPLLAEPTVVAAPRPFSVDAFSRETHDTWTLRLEPLEGPRLEVLPGQFNMLYAFGVGEVPISVSGDPHGPLVHTIRAVGPVSRALCAARRGDVLGGRSTRPSAVTSPSSRAGSGSRRCGRRSTSCSAGARSSARSRSSTAAARRAICSSSASWSAGAAVSTFTSA